MLIFYFAPGGQMQIKNMEKYKLAKLDDANGDLSKRWRVFYSYRNPESGKFQRFQVSISSKILTKTNRHILAKEKIKAINLKLQKGWSPFAEEDPKFSNLIGALRQILTIKERTTRNRTYRTYKNIVNTFITWLDEKKLHTLSAEELNYTHARRYMDHLLTNKKYAARTYNNHLSDLRTIFNVLIAREFILINPFSKIEMLPFEEAEIIAFSPEELSVVVNQLPEYNYNLYIAAMLVFYCFLRPQEIMRLKIGDIDLKREIIVVRGRVTKNKKQETIKIPATMVNLLVEWKTMDMPIHWHLFNRELEPGIKEFPSTRLAEQWRKFADSVGIERVMYDLKHTGAGMAIDNGMNLRDLQMHLRHSSLAVTQQYLEKFRNLVSERFLDQFPDLQSLYRVST